MASIVSIPNILFMSAIFFLLSTQNVVTSTRMMTSSSSWIEDACTKTGRPIDSKLCIQILESEREVVSTKTLLKLSIAIMELGISNTTNTHKYIETSLNKPVIDPNLKSALQKCNELYALIVLSFSGALSEVRDDDEYETATYDLLLASTDYLQPCIDIVASKKIIDETISIGNEVVPIFGLSASKILDRLY